MAPRVCAEAVCHGTFVCVPCAPLGVSEFLSKIKLSTAPALFRVPSVLPRCTVVYSCPTRFTVSRPVSLALLHSLQKKDQLFPVRCAPALHRSSSTSCLTRHLLSSSLPPTPHVTPCCRHTMWCKRNISYSLYGTRTRVLNVRSSYTNHLY